MKKLARYELEIMQLFWRMGEVSIREVHGAIESAKRPAYTTVQTVVQRLETKGALRRTRKIGNAFLFEAAVTRRSAYRVLLDDVLTLFGGSAQPLVAQLLESGRLTLDELKALENAERKRKARK
jgi:BlaI family transcriptional regulator, penicillinase repressor